MGRKQKQNINPETYEALGNGINNKNSEEEQYRELEEFNKKENLKDEVKQLQEEINKLLRPEGVVEGEGWHDRLEGSIFKEKNINEENIQSYFNFLYNVKKSLSDCIENKNSICTYIFSEDNNDKLYTN